MSQRSGARVAAVQLSSTGDVSENLAAVRSVLEEIAQSGADPDLIVFPENTLFFRQDGQSLVEFDMASPEISELRSILPRLFPKAHILIGGTPWKQRKGESSERAYNSALLFKPVVEGSNSNLSDVEEVYRKVHLFDVALRDGTVLKESAQFQRGGHLPQIFQIQGVSAACLICYDLRFPELFRGLGEVDLILIPSAFTVPTGQAHWETLVRARAIESQAYVVAPAQVGPNGNRSTFGSTLIVDPWGRVLQKASDVQSKKPGEKWTILYETVDTALVKSVREQMPLRQHRGERLWKPC